MKKNKKEPNQQPVQKSNKFFDAKGFFMIAAVIVAIALFYTFIINRSARGLLLIDNPMSYEINVQIGDQEFKVPAYDYVSIDLDEGKYNLTCKETGIINQPFEIKPVKYGVINPTKSKYIIYNIVSTKKEARETLKPTNFEGKEIFYYPPLGKPEATTSLFVADLSEGPGNINMKETKPKDFVKFDENHSYVRKIYREKDFNKFWEDKK